MIAPHSAADASRAAPSGPPRLAVRTVAFLWGLQLAFLSPALALLLVSLYGASTAQVSLVLAVYNAACLLSSWAIPAWADRRRDYVRPMLGCAGFTVALSGVLITTHTLPLAVTGLVLLGAPAAVGTPLLFGHMQASGAAPGQIVSARAVFSMAWVAGPPAASAVIATAGGHALVWAIGATGAVNLPVIATLLSRRQVGTAVHADEASRTAPAPRSVVVVLIAVFALLQAGNSAAVAVTALFVTEDLRLSPLWGGAALGLAAALEVPVLFLLGRRNRRVRDLPLLMLACLLGVGYYLAMATAHHGATIVAVQMVNAGFYGVVAGTGLTLFQASVPGPGAAAGMLANAQRVGALLAGPLIGLGSVVGGGLRTVFVAGAVLTLLSLGLLETLRRSGSHRPVPAGSPGKRPSPVDPPPGPGGATMGA